MLAAMLRSRSGRIKQGCFGGGCGVCRMKIAKGEYEKIKRMSRAHVSQADEEAGVVLLCCVQPRGDLEISNATQGQHRGNTGGRFSCVEIHNTREPSPCVAPAPL